MTIKEAKTGNRIEGYFLVKRCEVKVSAKGAKYLDMLIGDKTGEMDAKYWDYDPEDTPVFETNSIIKIRGMVNEYRGAPQLRVDMVRRSLPQDHINPSDYIASSEYNPEQMFNEIIHIAQDFQDEDLKNLLITTYERYTQQLLYYPAAIRLHHAMRGGLLYHTLSIIRMCQKAAEVYPLIDRDLLICGAALHDIGKVSEMDSNELGAASQYTTDGNLIGHLVRGAIMVHDIGKELRIPEEKLMLIEHMLISHHGKPEYGAAERPKFLEASILAKLDELDATIYEISDAVGSVEAGEFTQRMWALDDVRLYNHGRTKDLKPKADLL